MGGNPAHTTHDVAGIEMAACASECALRHASLKLTTRAVGVSYAVETATSFESQPVVSDPNHDPASPEVTSRDTPLPPGLLICQTEGEGRGL